MCFKRPSASLITEPLGVLTSHTAMLTKFSLPPSATCLSATHPECLSRLESHVIAALHPLNHFSAAPPFHRVQSRLVHRVIFHSVLKNFSPAPVRFDFAYSLLRPSQFSVCIVLLFVGPSIVGLQFLQLLVCVGPGCAFLSNFALRTTTITKELRCLHINHDRSNN